MSIKKLIDISLILDLANYLSSLQRWLELSSLSMEPTLEERYFNLYIKVVKPVIHKYHNIISRLDPTQFGFCSKILRTKQVKSLQEVYPSLAKFQILSQEQLNQLEVISQYDFVSIEQFNKLAGEPKTNIYRIILEEQPKNDQYDYWNTTLPIEKIDFQSIVIHGKGIAKKQLGFPTANLQVTPQIQEHLRDHPNGIYLVEFTFLEGLKYYGVCCIGTNPHYENLTNRRVIQVYIYNDFGQQQFYGATIKMKLLVLMRFEGKFATFDSFLNAMHNDIYMGKQMAKKIVQNQV